MAEPVVHRPRRRDAAVLAVLAVVLIGGLVHYSRGIEEERSRQSAGAGQTTSPSPTAEATAQLESGPSSDPAAPPPASRGTCWDGRETTGLKLCGLPEGARGLAWVFPSFARDRARCHQARPNTDSYPVVESYECFQRALGRPVTVTYDQVEDPARVAHWLAARVGEPRRIPGPNGGRLIFKDGRNQPARITGLYARFPYVVSVYADTPQAASRAWKVLVQQRPEDHIRGIPAG